MLPYVTIFSELSFRESAVGHMIGEHSMIFLPGVKKTKSYTIFIFGIFGINT